MIFLFTDFGSADLYLGQVKAVLAQTVPGAPVIDLLNDAPKYRIAAGAHLLAALAGAIPAGSVTLAVVDPGVGTARRPVVVRCAERWFVGPDNGLLSVLALRHADSQYWEIVWRPAALSRSFHGRDLFAPVAGRLAAGRCSPAELAQVSALDVDLDSRDLYEVVYLDSYGNAMTGIRAATLAESASIMVGAQAVHHAGVFADAQADNPFWYCNSIGLAEIACNRASAAERLQLRIASPVTVIPGTSAR